MGNYHGDNQSQNPKKVFVLLQRLISIINLSSVLSFSHKIPNFLSYFTYRFLFFYLFHIYYHVRHNKIGLQDKMNHEDRNEKVLSTYLDVHVLFRHSSWVDLQKKKEDYFR